MSEPFRQSLKALWSEFRRCAYIYSPLFHERMNAPNENLSLEAWKAFSAECPTEMTAETISWEGPSTGSWYGRFWGNKEGLSEFRRLCESLDYVLSEIASDTPGEAYFQGLNALYDIAYGYPTPLLRLETRLWDWEDESLSGDEHADAFEKHVNEMRTVTHSDIEYPAHPFCETLAQNVFTSAMAAIDLLLNPGDALLLGSSATLPFTLPPEDEDDEDDKDDEDDDDEDDEDEDDEDEDDEDDEDEDGEDEDGEDEDGEDEDGEDEDVGVNNDNEDEEVQGADRTEGLQDKKSDNESQYIFKREGDGWHIRYLEEQKLHVPAKKGYEHYAFILSQSPFQPIKATDIDSTHFTEGRSIITEDEHLQAIGDVEELPSGQRPIHEIDKALGKVGRKELEELIRRTTDSLDIARDAGDDEGVASHKERLAELTKWKQKTVDRKGRTRAMWHGLDVEKALKRVERNLGTCRQDMRKGGLSKLADYLASTIRTEHGQLVYRPPVTIEWNL